MEFLLHLKFAPYKTSYEKYRSELINDSKECMFEQVISVPKEDGGKKNVTDELILRRAIAAIQRHKSDQITAAIPLQSMPTKQAPFGICFPLSFRM